MSKMDDCRRNVQRMTRRHNQKQFCKQRDATWKKYHDNTKGPEGMDPSKPGTMGSKVVHLGRQGRSRNPFHGLVSRKLTTVNRDRSSR